MNTDSGNRIKSDFIAHEQLLDSTSESSLGTACKSCGTVGNERFCQRCESEITNVYEGSADEEGEILFFDKFMVLFHIVLLPVNALITYSFFYRSKYNYAEVTVLCLYTVSFFLLVSVIVSLLKFYWRELDTAYIELPLILLYISITNIHFFNSDKPFTVILKSIGITVCVFIILQLTEDFVVNNI